MSTEISTETPTVYTDAAACLRALDEHRSDGAGMMYQLLGALDWLDEAGLAEDDAHLADVLRRYRDLTREWAARRPVLQARA